MAERFRVIFSGKLVPGAKGDEVLKRLMQLFRADAAAVRKRFTKPVCTVVPDVDRPTGERMLAAIRKAGAICELLPLAPSSPPSQKPKPAQESTVVDIRIGRTELSLAPLPCSRIGNHPMGLKTNRLDRPVIPVEAIIAISVFLPVEHGDPQLLLFSAGFKRPLQIGAQQITFGEFAGISGTRMIDSLRGFLKMLCEKSPALIIDRHTDGFIKGEELHLFADNPNFLATALFHAHPLIAEATLPDRQPKILPDQPKAPQAAPASPATHPKEGKPEPEQEDLLGRWEEQLAPFTSWFDRLLLICSIAFIAGFLLPLYESTLPFDSNALVWFWNLMGYGLTPEQGAAQAALSPPDVTGAWVLTPLAAGLITFLLRSAPFVLRTGGSLLLALSFLSYVLVDTIEEVEIFGLLLVPTTTTAGTMILLVLLASAVTVAISHVRKFLSIPFWMVMLSGVCGGLIASATLIALVAGIWKGWIIYILYAVMGGFGLAALYQGFRNDDEDEQTGITGTLARVVLVVFPVVSILMQDALKDDVIAAILSGERLIHDGLSTLKLCLITYPAAILLAAGLSMIFAILVTAEEDA